MVANNKINRIMNIKSSNLSFLAVVLIFVLVIVIGLLTLNRPDLKFTLTINETLEQGSFTEDEIFPEDLVGIIEMEEPGYAIMDIRSPFEFIKGHISGAINIPTNNLLDKENIKMFKQYAADSVVVIMYAQDQLDANGPWLILKQMGYNNIKVLLGGYHYFTTGPLDFYDMPEVPDYLVEEPAYDFYTIMEELGTRSIDESITSDDQPQVVVTKRKKKESVVEGGC